MKKYTAILLAALMLLGALSGCAKKNTTAAAETADAAGTQTTATGTAATGTAATTEDQGLLGDILKKGVLTISLSPDFAPMEFVDTSKQGQDQYVGFDVTLAKYIADQLGVTLQIEAMEFSACQAAVQMGRVDMLYAAKVLAQTACELYEAPWLLAEARAEWQQKSASGYVCPIEPGVVPTAVQNRG